MKALLTHSIVFLSLKIIRVNCLRVLLCIYKCVYVPMYTYLPHILEFLAHNGGVHERPVATIASAVDARAVTPCRCEQKQNQKGKVHLTFFFSFFERQS